MTKQASKKAASYLIEQETECPDVLKCVAGGEEAALMQHFEIDDPCRVDAYDDYDRDYEGGARTIICVAENDSDEFTRAFRVYSAAEYREERNSICWGNYSHTHYDYTA